MKILIDKNNLLAIENSNIPKSKEYCYNLGWYEFCDFDKWIIVYHKKQFKIIHLRDLWDKMWVIMIGKQDEELIEIDLVLESVENALKLFNGFDEDTGEKYYFLQKFNEDKLNELNLKLKKLWSNIIVNKTKKGFCIENKDEELTYDPISFLFGLWIVYGDLNIKQNDLKSIKIQIPLFGSFQGNEDIIDESLKTLIDNNIFFKKNIQKTNDGIVYQITSSDNELLEIFAKFYQGIEKWIQISKVSELEKVKNELVKFLENNQDIPS